MPDFAAISASCSSIMALAGSSPASPPGPGLGILGWDRCVPPLYPTEKRTNSPTVRVRVLRAILLFLGSGTLPRWAGVCLKFLRNAIGASRYSVRPADFSCFAAVRRSISLVGLSDRHRLVTPDIGEHLLQVVDLR